MKILSLVCSILICSCLFSQTKDLTIILDNDVDQALGLYAIHNKKNALYQLKQGTNSFRYYLEELDNGEAFPLEIDGVVELYSVPVEIEEGLLFAADTEQYGIELMLYDGETAVRIPLNRQGKNSYPEIKRVRDHIFIIAHQGDQRQLFEFISFEKVVQVSRGEDRVEKVCALFDDAIYYHSTTKNNKEAVLNKAKRVGDEYIISQITRVAAERDQDYGVTWKDPHVIDDKLYLNQVITTAKTAKASRSSIVEIDKDDKAYEVHTTAQFGLIENSHFFKWNNAYYTYIQGDTNIYASLDGGVFKVFASITDGELGEWAEWMGSLYVIKEGQFNQELLYYDGGFKSIIKGHNLDFIYAKNQYIVLSDWSEEDSSRVIVVHAVRQGVQVFAMGMGRFNAHENSVVEYEEQFYFLYTPSLNDQDVADVFRFDGVINMGGFAAVDIKVYPNPIIGNAVLTVESPKKGVYTLLTTDGRIVQSSDLLKGKSMILLPNLEAGPYFFELNGELRRILVLEQNPDEF